MTPRPTNQRRVVLISNNQPYRADHEAWHGTKAPYDAKQDRKPRTGSLFLAGCVVILGLLFALTMALTDHLIERTRGDIAHAMEMRSM